jgi:hypothetical protein
MLEFSVIRMASSFFDYDRSKIVKKDIYTGTEIRFFFWNRRIPLALMALSRKARLCQVCSFKLLSGQARRPLVSSFVHIYSQRVGTSPINFSGAG